MSKWTDNESIFVGGVKVEYTEEVCSECEKLREELAHITRERDMVRSILVDAIVDSLQRDEKIMAYFKRQ